ncbi:MAG: ABC transporter ATP-binding protein [Clostridia bacterium]|nr:ABC transporter ATP-binding protein [Clostridia bacterium]
MIEVRELVKRYGEKTALDGLSFTVKSGEIVGLLGLNGAGKSTTMNILTGYISPTAGTVRIDGHDIVKEPREAKRVVGYLPEQFAFYPDMRVMEYLSFVCDLKGYTPDKKKREAHLLSIAREVGIEHMAGRMIRNLSKGYKQRVGFAQALIGDPRVLILDEPTVGLDPSQIIEIRRLIKNAGHESTVVVSSHILSEIQAICSRVLVLHEGRLVADGAPEELTRRLRANHRLAVRILGGRAEIERALSTVPDVKKITPLPQREPGAEDYLVIGRRGKDIRRDLFAALAKANLPLLHTYGGELSLEDVFLHLTGKDAGEEAEA